VRGEQQPALICGELALTSIVARQVAGDCRATPAISRLTGAASQQGARNRCAMRASELTGRASLG